MIETLTLLFILPYIVSSQSLSKKGIENGILTMAFLQIGCMSLQSIDAIGTYNEIFPITGFSDNPNVSAILLAVCLPRLYRKMKASSYRILWLALIFLSITFIIALKCRSAYLYLAVVIAVRLLLSNHIRHFWGKIRVWGRSSLVITSLLAIIAFGMVLYRSNQASADGRLLIWKVSTMMIKEHPLGVGIGMFEHDYNLRQGDYFASGESTEMERYNSGTVFMAYNDFLEHAVEVGVPGLLFLLSFYGCLMIMACRVRDKESLSFIIGFFVMSLINFIYNSIQPWIVLMAYASLLISAQREETPIRREFANKAMGAAALIICLVLLCLHTPLLCSQLQLKQLQIKVQNGESINIQDAESLAAHIGTSEAYYRFLSEHCSQQGEYDKALHSILKAKQYTSTPDVLFSCFDCHDKMGRPEEGIRYIEELSMMLPQNLTSRLVLLNWNDSMGNEREAFRIAHEIAEMHVKVRTQRSDEIQHYANRYLLKHHKSKLISK